MNKYDSLVETGIDWLGQIPTHWKKLKWGYRYKSGMGKTILKEDLDENGEVPVYSATKDDIIFGYINNPKFILDKGDIVIPARGNSIGHVKIVSRISTATQTTIYSRTKDKKINSKYSYYYCKGNRKELFPFEQTAIPQITVREISFNPLILPPINEQQSIVSFLDNKYSLVNTIIEKTNKRISLLEEKKYSTINDFVTKGLNPNTEFKDSYVKWIQKVPSHWKVGKIHHYCKMISGATPSRKIPEYWEDGKIPWMSSGEINKKEIKNIDGRITDLGFRNSSVQILPIQTVMIALNGQGKTKGTVGILEIETTCNQSLCGMIFNQLVVPKYAYYFLDSQYNTLRGLVGDGEREGISVSFLGRLPICIPPINEQKKIVNYLDKETQTIEKSIFIEKNRIKLLEEYLESITSEVVNGKLKVI